MKVAKTIADMSRVWKVTKKPTKKEYFLTLKIVLVGLLVIGLIALIFEFANQLLIKRIFA